MIKNQYVKKGTIVSDIKGDRGTVIDFDKNSFIVIWDSDDNVCRKYNNTWIEYGHITVMSGFYTLV